MNKVLCRYCNGSSALAVSILMIFALLGAVSAVAQGLPADYAAAPGKAAGRSGQLIHCNGFESIIACPAGLAGAPLILLEQLAPLTGQIGGSLPILHRAGWPLIFRASVQADDMLGIGLTNGRQAFEPQGLAFPEPAQGGAIVFENPDGNWSFAVPTNAPHDELLVHFVPEPGDVSGTLDDVIDIPLSHDPALRFILRPEFGGPLPQSAPDGSFVQNVARDGVQFGADDDFTGLVIVSNTGVGVVMSTLANGWNPLLPRQARNLAGFTNAVGYELSDTLSRTSITSTLIVPRFLFSRIRLRDMCVGVVSVNGKGEPIACSGAPLQRVDGGAVTPLLPAASIDQSIVELRAFVVAPTFEPDLNRLIGMDTVTDMNGDGVVGAIDASLMGRRVLSNELVFNFRQVGSDVSASQINNFSIVSFCNGTARPDNAFSRAGADMEFDLDGNGYAFLDNTGICPGSSSGVTQPPR